MPRTGTSPDTIAVGRGVTVATSGPTWQTAAKDHVALTATVCIGPPPPTTPTGTGRIRWRKATPAHLSAFSAKLDALLAHFDDRNSHRMHDHFVTAWSKAAHACIPHSSKNATASILRTSPHTTAAEAQETAARKIRSRMARLHPTEVYRIFAGANVGIAGARPTANELARDIVNKHMAQSSGARSTEPIQQDGGEMPPITTAELDAALRHKVSAAPDGDGITPRGLRHLGPEAKRFLARLFHKVLTGASDVPHQWRHAIVIPLLKEGKPSERPSSYRPISLTSLLSRTAEKVILRRVEYLLPRGAQYGYLRNRSAPQAIANVMDAVRAGLDYQTKPPRQYVEEGETHAARGQRGFLAAIDFTDAFARVSRQAAVDAIRRHNLPLYVEKFVDGWLRQRTFTVRAPWDPTSATAGLDRGIPQGSVIGPMIWGLVIAPLLTKLETLRQKVCEQPPPLTAQRGAARALGVSVACFAAYADDLTLAVLGDVPTIVRQKLDIWLSAVVAWAEQHNINISDKTKILGLASQARMLPPLLKHTFTLGTHAITTQQDPVRVLGFMCEYDMALREQGRKDAKEMEARVQPLRPMASWSTPQAVREAYCAFGMGYVTYGAEVKVDPPEKRAGSTATLMKRYPAETWKALEVAHGIACRAVTGTVATASTAACVRVAGFRSLRCEMYRLAQRALAKQASMAGKPWLVGDALVKLLPELKALPYDVSLPADHVHFYTDIGAGLTRESPDADRHADTVRRMDAAGPADLDIYTDGAYTTTPVPRSGGGVAMETTHDDIARCLQALGMQREEQYWTLATPGPALACSYTAETVAVTSVLPVLRSINASRTHTTVRLVTDSKSLLDALDRGPTRQRDAARAHIWTSLLAVPNVTLKCVFSFGHCGIAGNEAADKVAEKALSLPPTPVTWYVDAARENTKAVQGAEDDEAAAKDHLRFFPPGRRGPCFEKRLPPKSVRTISQLRTGVYTPLGYREGDTTCPRCCLSEMGRTGRAVTHLFLCTNAAAVLVRRSTQLEEGVMDAIWNPKKLSAAIAYAEWFGGGGPAPRAEDLVTWLAEGAPPKPPWTLGREGQG
jgi:ribonuclease HI